MAQSLPQLRELQLGTACTIADGSIDKDSLSAVTDGMPQLTLLSVCTCVTKVDNCGLDTQSARSIADKLKQLTTLNLGPATSDLANNNSIGVDGARAIAQGLPRLTSLNVCNCLPDSDYCDIGLDGCRAICGSLRQLTSLNMGSNYIGDEGAEVIAQQLPGLTRLEL